jgi:vacuolar-type H+-ATPase subunit H
VARDLSAGSNAANAGVVERVLDAERSVEGQVRKAIEEADFIVRSARARGDAIRKRADDRISRLHVAMEERIETEIARLRKEFQEAEDSPANDPQFGVKRDALRRAVRRLAARMTGEIDDGGR